MTKDWGSIDAVVNAPLHAVGWNETWVLALLMWVLLPVILLQGLICAIFQFAYRIAFVWVNYSSQLGNPPYLALVYLPAQLASGLSLVFRKGSRVRMFAWLRAAFGSGEHFFQGEGVWTCSHKEVDKMIQSEQHRHVAFGCTPAPAPDLFPTSVLIFLPNVGTNSDWRAIRNIVHQFFLDQGSHVYQQRVAALPKFLIDVWPNPSINDLNNAELVRKNVSKCIWYIMFGKTLSEDEATTVSCWSSYAAYFVLPRLFHRFLFNVLINKVKKLRADTVQLVEKYGDKDIFVKMNESLPAQYQRPTVVQLCDEIMFGVGFAGIGGTSAAALSVGAFLQRKFPSQAASELIDFSKFPTQQDMINEFKAHPENYIKETCRLDPPVTSATSAFIADTEITMAGVFSQSAVWKMAKGRLNQYCLSAANQDPAVFHNPNLFEPTRADLSKSLTWNGAWGTHNDEATYPRMCLGRNLSVSIVEAVIQRGLSGPLKPGSETASLLSCDC